MYFYIYKAKEDLPVVIEGDNLLETDVSILDLEDRLEKLGIDTEEGYILVAIPSIEYGV